MSQEVKRKIHYTPQNSPNKYSKTPQSNESLKKDAKSQSERQWSKHMGIQTPLSETGIVRENLITEEMKQMHVIEERKIQKLQKKLQIAEETISSLSTSHEIELRAKEEILQQLNNDWESITKYYYEISESLKGFQQHKDNLSKLYNEIIKQENLTSMNQELQVQLQKITEEKQNLTILFAEKDDEIIKLQGEIEFENTHKLSKKKYETEIKSLKQEFDVKLIEMKKTLTTQNSAYLKLNENNLKEKMQPLIESIPIEIIKKIESQTNQICEVKEFQNQENINNSKIIIKDKNEISNLEQDIYSFSTREINDELQNILSVQEKKVRFNLNSPTKVKFNIHTHTYS
ncbi:interaptin-like [Apis dorsata]|uniref:interaptin-like n=1 Tax=Apis dorsata TaxID=7462 RepID=UPI001293AF32|nr:interaptin-like [Apis dorsata]